MISILLVVASLTINPYRTLGLEKGASASQIRAAFRKQARVLHPDSVGGNAKLFRELVEAVELLQSSDFAPSEVQYDSPRGLTPLERVEWFVANNHVVLGSLY